MAKTRGSSDDWNGNRRRFLMTGGSLVLGGLVGCKASRHEQAERPQDADPATMQPPSREAGSRLLDPSAHVPAPTAYPIAPTPDDLPGARWAAPDLSQGRWLRNIAGIRPYRRGSVRIEVARVHGRPVIHNYGHGGAGITLAPGSAFEVLDLLALVQPEARKVAVLGSGVNGLTVATELLHNGFEVEVYAEDFPPNTTSNVAGGQFAPSLVAHGRTGVERLRFDRLIERSYHHYARLIGRGFGVFPRLNYTVRSAGSALRRVPQFDHAPVQSFDQLPIQGVRSSGYAYPTLLIEPPIYLARLHGDLASRGVAFHEKRFEFLDELKHISADVIINCLGLGAGDLFNDALVVPIRGQLVLMEPQDLPFLLSNSGYLFPRTDCIVLGGTVERGDRNDVPSSGRCEQILRQHQRFFAGS